MTSLNALVETALASGWLPVLLTIAVAADGPFPVLPSEPLLFAAVARAAGDGAHLTVALLFTSALAGSLLGDAILYLSGRSSRRVVPLSERTTGWAVWARRHLLNHPILVLAVLRLVPGGRLTSVTAAGRAGVGARRFVRATVLSSLLWTTYMTSIGLLLSRLTGGDAVWSLLAGLGSGVFIASVAALVGRLRGLSVRAGNAASAAAAARRRPRAGCRG